MKYIIINDLVTCFKKYKWYLLGYLISIISFIMIQLLVGFKLDNDLFYDILGLNASIEKGILALIMYILNIIFYLLITVTVFTTDIKVGIENIFLRMSIKKWITIKLVSIIFISFLLKLLTFILIIIIYSINTYFIKDIIFIFFLNNIYLILIELIFLLIYIIGKKYKFIIPIISVILVLSIKYLIISVINLKDYILYGVIIIFILIFIIIKNNKKYLHLFE